MTPTLQHGKKIERLLFLLMVSLCAPQSHVFAQAYPFRFFTPEYMELRWKADSLFNLKQYHNAVGYYQKAAKLNVVKRFKRFCDNRAYLCYRELGDRKKAIKNYRASLKKGLRYDSLAFIYRDTFSINYLKKDKHWASIEKQLVENTMAYHQNTNIGLRKELLMMKELDMLSEMPSVHDSLSKIYSEETTIQKVVYEMRTKQIEKNIERFREILKEYGWPGIKLVGNDGEASAWLMAQHATKDSTFQRYCMQLIEKAIIKDDSRLPNYPYFSDRLSMWQGKQYFGTQFNQITDKTGKVIDVKPMPLYNEKIVNKLRNCFVMETLESYINYAKGRYVGKY